MRARRLIDSLEGSGFALSEAVSEQGLVEQTMLDLAHRPALGGLTAEQASEAVRTLALRADWEETLQLARRQRLHAAYRRARWVADTVLDKATPDWPSRRPVPGLGLRPPTPGDDGFGIAPNRPDDAPS